MRRFLVIEDGALSFDDELRSDNVFEGIVPDVEHIDPTDYIGFNGDPEADVKHFLGDVAVRAEEFWDVIAIDLYLGDFGFEEERVNLEICLRVAETVRDRNKAATIFFYSGTLAKFIAKILDNGASDTQLRRIFAAGVSNFVPRHRIAAQITSAVDDPSWILRVDRLLTSCSKLAVVPEEAEFIGRSFSDLARSVRMLDKDGYRIMELIGEYGIVAFVDLNS